MDQIDTEGLVRLFTKESGFVVRCVSFGTNFSNLRKLLNRNNLRTVGQPYTVWLDAKKATQEIVCSILCQEIACSILCPFCGKEPPKYQNYCSWDCHIGAAKKAGGKEFLPNGLPIGSISWDGTMLECEHGDHPQYKYPVSVEQDYGKPVGVIVGLHALLYEDSNVALTLYEARYWLFNLRNGKCLNSSDMRMTEECLIDFAKRRMNGKPDKKLDN